MQWAGVRAARFEKRKNRPTLVGDTFFTRFCLAGCADFTVSYFHFPAKKSVQKGEVGSDPRAVTFFNEVPCPPALRFTISWRTGGLTDI
jgi:hypothetical protein